MIHFPIPTNDTRLLTRYAKIGLQKIFQKGRYYAKAGVMLTNITPEKSMQMNLFQKKDSQKSQKLMKIVDNINKVYGNKVFILLQKELKKSG